MNVPICLFLSRYLWIFYLSLYGGEVIKSACSSPRCCIIDSSSVNCVLQCLPKYHYCLCFLILLFSLLSQCWLVLHHTHNLNELVFKVTDAKRSQTSAMSTELHAPVKLHNASVPQRISQETLCSYMQCHFWPFLKAYLHLLGLLLIKEYTFNWLRSTR